MVAKFNGTTSFLENLDEESVNEIVSHNGTLYIGGVDPYDSWALGNIYTYTNSTFTKIRTGNGLTNVIHTWGLHIDSYGTLYAAVSSHDGSFLGTCNLGVSCFGEVFKSTNNGTTWTEVSRLGNYRVFDITRFNGNLYALYVNDVTADNNLAYSTNDGSSWTTLKSNDGLRRTHLTEFDGKLIMLGNGTSNDTIFAVDSSNGITSYTLPFSVGVLYDDATYFSNYNQFVVADDGFLYTISNEGDVWRSSDLTNWLKVADTGSEFISIGYWSQRNWLVLSTRGASATIYYIDLDNNYKTQITGFHSNINIFDTETDLDVETQSSLFTAANRNLRVKDQGGVFIADVEVDLTESRNWINVTGQSDPESGRSVISGLSTASGASSTHTLYVPIPNNSNATDVVICPHAVVINDAITNCNGGVWFKENETRLVDGSSVSVTLMTSNSRRYWKATGLTGTGGIDASSRTNTSNSGSSVPEILINQSKVIERDSTILIIEENSVAYDMYSSINRIQKVHPIGIRGYWQVSDIYNIWLRSYFNGAKIYDANKRSIVGLKFDPNKLSNDGKHFFNIKGLKLANSTDDGKSWRLLPTSIVDVNSNTVAALHKIGGKYMIVGNKNLVKILK